MKPHTHASAASSPRPPAALHAIDEATKPSHNARSTLAKHIQAHPGVVAACLKEGFPHLVIEAYLASFAGLIEEPCDLLRQAVLWEWVHDGIHIKEPHAALAFALEAAVSGGDGDSVCVIVEWLSVCCSGGEPPSFEPARWLMEEYDKSSIEPLLMQVPHGSASGDTISSCLLASAMVLNVGPVVVQYAFRHRSATVLEQLFDRGAEAALIVVGDLRKGGRLRLPRETSSHRKVDDHSGTSSRTAGKQCVDRRRQRIS